jgi:hypothetical protein
MAERSGTASVGQTFLSNLVATKARAIWEDISALSSDASGMGTWAFVWAVCEGPAATSARALIISLITRSAADVAVTSVVTMADIEALLKEL